VHRNSALSTATAIVLVAGWSIWQYLHQKKLTLKKLPIFFILILIFLPKAYATDHTVDLVVDYKAVDFSGECRKALAINNQIPAPTLHFKEGDHITINVHNHLDEGTSIHWHGLLVPWNMDGVEGVSQEPIPPGKVFSYKFKLKQSGTYWYHAHDGLQEQEGLYGGFIIDPLEPPAYQYEEDHVIVLSDWSDTAAEQIFANLKKDGHYYSSEFPIQPSLLHFIKEYDKASPKERKKLIEDYEMMQEMRMNIYDFSDVAYDAFLLNGRTKCDPWTASVKVGDTVRLRFIGAGASTIFRVKIPGTKMEVVHIQGHDVEPYSIKDFTIAPGETTDVLVKIQKDSPYIIYAESSDTLGAAYGALVTHPEQQVNYQEVQSFPIPEAVMMGSHMMGHGAAMGQGGMKHETMKHGEMEHEAPSMDSKSSDHQMPMNSDQHDMPMSMNSEKHNMDTMKERSNSSHAMMGSMDQKSSPTTGTKYQNLKATFKTNDPNKLVQEIKMVLSGYMGRFMWFINGLPEFEAEPILIEPGKRYRIIFTNESMMNHPMHLHGHFFILRNGHGEYDPFLHTIEVSPGATVVADFDADASGQWFFHCHHLYHMMAGMSRVFRYSTFMEDYQKTISHEKSPPSKCSERSSQEPEFVKHPMGHHPHLGRATFLDLGVDPYHNVQKGNLNFLAGWDMHKLQLYSEDAEIRKGKIEEADLDIFYWYGISEFWAIKGGANYVYKPSHHPYWQPGVGVEGLFPYFIYTNVRTYLHGGSVKFDIQVNRDTQLTNRLFLKTGLRGVFATQTVKRDQIGRGLNYIEYTVKPYIVLTPGLALFTEFDWTQNYGNLKKIDHNKGQSASEKVFMMGVSFLF
jgi:CopA family copper-resistance protein